MKKVYQKPVLLKEEFRMEEMIAANCGTINTNPTQNDECNYTLPGLSYPLFVDGWQSCWLHIEDYQQSGLTILCKAPGANAVFSS